MLNSDRHRGVAGSQRWLVPGRMALACAVRRAVLCELPWPWPPERRGAGRRRACRFQLQLALRASIHAASILAQNNTKTYAKRMQNAAGSADFTSGVGF